MRHVALTALDIKHSTQRGCNVCPKTSRQAILGLCQKPFFFLSYHILNNQQFILPFNLSLWHCPLHRTYSKHLLNVKKKKKTQRTLECIKIK